MYTTAELKHFITSISGGSVKNFQNDSNPVVWKAAINLDMENAYYDGEGIVFGDAFFSDDIIGHEVMAFLPTPHHATQHPA